MQMGGSFAHSQNTYSPQGGGKRVSIEVNNCFILYEGPVLMATVSLPLSACLLPFFADTTQNCTCHVERRKKGRRQGRSVPECCGIKQIMFEWKLGKWKRSCLSFTSAHHSCRALYSLRFLSNVTRPHKKWKPRFAHLLSSCSFCSLLFSSHWAAEIWFHLTCWCLPIFLTSHRCLQTRQY